MYDILESLVCTPTHVAASQLLVSVGILSPPIIVV